MNKVAHEKGLAVAREARVHGDVPARAAHARADWPRRLGRCRHLLVLPRPPAPPRAGSRRGGRQGRRERHGAHRTCALRRRRRRARRRARHHHRAARRASRRRSARLARPASPRGGPRRGARRRRWPSAEPWPLAATAGVSGRRRQSWHRHCRASNVLVVVNGPPMLPLSAWLTSSENFWRESFAWMRTRTTWKLG